MADKFDLNDWMGRWGVAIPPAGYAELVSRIRALESGVDSLASTLANVDKAVRETLGIDLEADDALPNLVADWMESRVSQPGSGEWRPIETAPKDGTEIILAKGERVTEGLWVGDRWPTASEYHGTTGEYLGQYETGECIEAYWMSFDGGFTEEDQPSHWMPLPAAPSAGNGEAKGGRE